MPHDKGTADRIVHGQVEGGAGGDTVVTNLPTDYAREATLLHKHGVVIPVVGSQNTATEETIFIPTVGTAPRLVRFWLRGSHSVPDTIAVEFILRMGGTEIDHDEVVTDQPYVNGSVREGAIDDIVTLELLTAQKVFFNLSVQEFV